MRFLACGIRDSQGQAGSGSENLALRDTGFSILLSGIQDLSRVLIKHINGLPLLSLPMSDRTQKDWVGPKQLSQ